MNLFPTQTKRVILSILWLGLTVSMGIWWLNLGLRQASLIADLKKTIGGNLAFTGFEELNRQSRMLQMEGGFFIILLIVGGSALLWLSYKDYERSKTLKDFFATVTHEMKTPIASLRLQAESLEDDIREVKHKNLVKRLISDTRRIESQIEKALYLASISRSENLYFEKVHLLEELKKIYIDGLKITIAIPKDISIRADKRALESIFRNLFENSKTHGKATALSISSNAQNNWISLKIEDNGNGFYGNYNKLGKAFARHSATSGSGVGLYLVINLLKKMNGSVDFKKGKSGFRIDMTMPTWKEN